MAVMMPVTNTTIPRTQNRPWHLVKSTYTDRETGSWRVITCVAEYVRWGHLKAKSCYLCLEAEDGDSNADDSSDHQSEEHCSCVIITKTKEQHTFITLYTIWILTKFGEALYLPGYGSSHVGQSQSL